MEYGCDSRHTEYAQQTIKKRISLVIYFFSNIIPISVKKLTQNRMVSIPIDVRKLTYIRIRRISCYKDYV